MATVTPSPQAPLPTSARTDHSPPHPHDKQAIHKSNNDDTAVNLEPDDIFSDSPLPGSSFFFAESAGLLTLFSLLIFIEGGIRVNAVDVKMFTRPPNVLAFPPVVSFIAAIAELLLGLLGLLLGISSLISRFFDRRLFSIAVLVQVTLSTFVFVVNNLADPIYRLDKLIPFKPRPIPNVSLYRAAESMALLIGVQFTLALFVGQLIFMTRLAASATGKDVWRARSGNRTNALVWNVNLGLAGLWTMILGSGVLSHKENFPRTAEISGIVFAFVPHIGTKPRFTIATGVIMIAWAAIGVVLTFRRFKNVSWYVLGSVLVAIIVYFNFTLVQLGLFRIGSSGGGIIATNTAFVFVIFFLSSYFLYRAKPRGIEKMTS